MSTTFNSTGQPNCQSSNTITHKNNTVVLYDAYNGIPGTLAVNSIAFVGLLLLFTFLRKLAWDYGRLGLVSRTEENRAISSSGSYDVWTSLFYGDNKKKLQSQDSVDSKIHSQDKGIFKWIIAFIKLKDSDILRKCGRDAVQYLSFQRYLLVYSLIITVISIVVILPINFQGNLLGNATEFGHTTIGNLDSESPLLWVHSLFSVLYLVIIICVLHHFHTNLDVEEDEQVSRTLMISNIPQNKCFEETLRLHFQEAYPEVVITDVQFAYNITDLVNLDRKRQIATEARVYSEEELRKFGKRPMMFPYMCGQLACSACCGCQQVDAITFYMNEEAELLRLCDEERVTAYRDPIGIAFITTESDLQAQRIRADFSHNCKGSHNPQLSRIYSDLHVQDWRVHFAPSPENINWENLAVPNWKWWTRAVCINGFLIIVLFFLTTPIMFLHTLDLLNIDLRKPGEQLHSTLLVQFLPTLLLLTLSSLLPNVVYLSEHYIGHWTKTAEHHAVMRKTFIFLLLMVLILPSLGLTSAKALFEWMVVNAEKRVQWQCIFLPSNGSFFINYVITAALIGTMLDLLRFSELFTYSLKLMMARSQAEKAAVRKSVVWDFQYGIHYTWVLCIFAIMVSYSIPCPMVTPFGMLYLSIKHLVDRYNIFFAYSPSRIDKHIHSSAVTFVLWAVIMLQINITFFTGLRTEGLDSVFLFSCVCLFLTLIIFVGRLSFGWFKHLRPHPYIHTEELDEGEKTPPDTDIPLKPFVADVLMEDSDSSSHHGSPTQPLMTYGATGNNQNDSPPQQAKDL
ncbi:osmosensitive cation channel TMEM63C-like isoform X2 [Babylonia areolata]|uniref:osmosensitive cation channel TMEM63C-like isoform X2 n=1 Tax=Babylonia areolata TaxID=304850 RepID=UPI003FD12A33